MRPRWLFLLLLLSCISSPGAAQRLARPWLPARRMACVIEPVQQTYYANEPILFRVRIENKTDSALTLVYALDGSEIRWRAPEVYFTARQLSPGPLPGPDFRCGNIGGIDSTAFVTVPPGGSFDPLSQQAQYAVQHPSIYPTLLAGEYEIAFHYSTLETKQGPWMGGTVYAPKSLGGSWTDQRARHLAVIARHLRRVPRVELISNVVRVRVEPARSTAAQLGGE